MELSVDVCGDCTAPSPQWASVNRGVFLCDECASIHRQLGRHISQVKHLKKSCWRPTQLEMVRYLAAAHVNRYWEHVLYEHMLAGQHLTRSASGSGRQPKTLARKPKPTDPLHPIKADFIREKYLFMGFFKKPRSVNQEDLDQQLHASVRTDVLEKSLHLLISGANPNFIHPTKGTSPLHVACYYGRNGQVEVLLAYGADLCVRDAAGQTPIDVAISRALSDAELTCSLPNASSLTPEQKLRLAWSPLVDLLVSAYYEVTDGLAYFLARSVPDHKAAALGSPVHHLSSSQTDALNTTASVSSSPPVTANNGHFLIRTSVLQTLNERASGDGLNGADHWIHEARRRLTQLSTPAIEDLCIDVYDEAERRLTNTFVENVDPTVSLHKVNGFAATGTAQSDFASPSHKLANGSCGVDRNLTLYFLPPNTTYSSVRNQARQKLGRLSTVEFHTLVLDVLVEVSAHLLPLFPPLRPQHHNAVPATSRHHPYSTYFAVTPLEELPVSVSKRLTPLPPPPLVEPRLLGLGSPTEQPTAPLTANSSRPSSPELDPTQDVSPSALINSGSSNDKIVCRNGDRRDRSRGTDPVYDQVAGESDAFGSMTQSGSTAPLSTLSSCSTVNDPTETISVGSRSSDPTCELNKSSVTSATRTPISLFDLTASGHIPPVSHAADSDITTCVGPIPGSRRLHLPHTGRVVQRRASVPCVQNGVVKFSAECPLSPILEATNLALDPLSRGPTFSNTQSAKLCDPCCVAARNEVERLRKENMDLRVKMSELQEAKNAVEERLRNLEDRVQQVDSVVETLKDEKSALLAAFSAGMIMTHIPPGPHKPSTRTAPSDRATVDAAVSSGNQSQQACSFSDTYDEDYKVNYADRRPDTGNYSVGSHCLDSGILLRQGIILRAGGGSRSGSPASSSPSSQSLSVASATVAPNSPLVKTKEECLSAGSSQSSINAPGVARSHLIPYVNMPPTQPQRVIAMIKGTPTPAANEPRVLSTTIPSSALITPNPSDTATDYTSPNSTGSASPAPIPPAENLVTKPITNNGRPEPGNRHPGQRHQQEIQTPHNDQILTSVSASLDYDVPPDQIGYSASSNVTSRVIIPYAPGINGSPTRFRAPTSDRVVRSVEAIIVRIRELVQLANGKQTGDFAHCSLLIQSAAKDILSLFPPFGQCPSRIERALLDLSSASNQLRPHCELMSRRLKSSGAAQRQGSGATGVIPRALAPEVNTLIQHTHQIAKAAKELLSIFQRSS
ncbi:unnamed protein product [Dicrocoelium dendriticum]|nr:unnamed protein product [Dicrocoelium dendriticum]